MPFRKLKPTSPGTRFQTVPLFDEITTQEPVQAAGRAAAEHRWPQQSGAPHLLVARRRPQADVPHHRLQAEQVRHSGEGGVDRVRPEPLGAHRAAELHGRREALHRGAARPQGRRHADVGTGSGHRDGQRAASAQRAARHLDPLDRDLPEPRRPHRALGRDDVPADGEGRRPRAGAVAVQRDAQVPSRLPLRDRAGRQHRPREHRDRQGRPQPLARHPPARARRGEEPGRSPDGRRRRQVLGRPASVLAVGPAGEGLQDAQQQAASGSSGGGRSKWRVPSRRARTSSTAW